MIHSLITAGYVNKGAQRKSMKCFVWPQYLVEPLHIEGYDEGGWNEDMPGEGIRDTLHPMRPEELRQ